jgi:hypothetical protein
VTQLRKMMLEEPQARKITALVLGWVEDLAVRSDSRGFGVAEASSKFELLRSFGDRWAPFFVTDSLARITAQAKRMAVSWQPLAYR